MSRFILPLLVLLALLPAAAEESGPETITIGYIELADDPRYPGRDVYTGIDNRTLGRPYPGAEVGLADAQAGAGFLGFSFALLRAETTGAGEAAQVLEGWHSEDEVHFVLVDLPAPELVALADAAAGLPVLLLNVSALADSLRDEQCRANVAHVIPSRSMLTDALVQYLLAQNWVDLLVLHGGSDADLEHVQALERSAQKFGARIVAKHPFELGGDPRNRDSNNVALMTGEPDHDVVYVADSSRQFAPFVPYSTHLPRPVVGDSGLRPLAWHWSWNRHGAPQLQHRFEEFAMPRQMNSGAWAAWAAMKAISQAAIRASSDPAEMRQFMLSDQLNLDGVKGNPSSFRVWNQQLRQPILLATDSAVIARAPVGGALHQTNVLDTLGADAPESRCQLDP